MATLYDNIGTGYNTTRRADAYITDRLYELLQHRKDGLYLDIGCGTGNYFAALSNKGLSLVGIDPSETMLNEARAKSPAERFMNATAENIPLPDAYFDGAIAMLTFHHWKDKNKGIAELYRVLKPGSRLVFFSFTLEHMKRYWLYHYFPQMIERSGSTAPPENEMKAMLEQNGFRNITTEYYLVTNELTDHFLYSNKYRPEQFLDPQLRKGMSAFAAYADDDEINTGLQQLEQDIASGHINDIIARYDNDKGDYLFYIADKI